MTLLGCWRQNYDLGDIFWMLVPDANVKRQRMLVTKTGKTVTNILKLSPTHFVPNFDVALISASWVIKISIKCGLKVSYQRIFKYKSFWHFLKVKKSENFITGINHILGKCPL